MSRTYGAYDLKPRKTRSDKGKSRKKYGGRPVKKKRKIRGKYIPYESIRQRGDPVHLQIHEMVEMSQEGRMRFHKTIRRYMWNTVYPFRVACRVPPEMLSTKESVGELVMNLVPYPGNFQLRMRGHAKNKYHSTARTQAIVKIRQHEEGLRAEVIPRFKRRGLYRYWFWRDGK